ncbi:MAG: SIMPL domain-containing protein [Hyphomonadaceae bacterium]
MKSAVRLAALAIVATPSLALAAQAQEDGVRPYWFDKPVIEALGRSDMEVPPNRARFDVTFVSTNSDAKKAMEDAVARARMAYEAIKKVAGDASRVTSGVDVQPYFEQYRDKDGNRIEDDRPDRVKGYEARAEVSVELTDVALAGKARAAALALGPEETGGGVRVYLEQTADLQRAALEAAAKDAAERARLTAAATGHKLGDILVLQEGSGPCMGNWSSGQIARVGGSGYGYPSPPPPPPAPAPMMERSDIVVTAQGRGRSYQITQDDLDRLNLPNDQRPQTIRAAVCAVFVLSK